MKTSTVLCRGLNKYYNNNPKVPYLRKNYLIYYCFYFTSRSVLFGSNWHSTETLLNLVVILNVDHFSFELHTTKMCRRTSMNISCYRKWRFLDVGPGFLIVNFHEAKKINLGGEQIIKP